MKLCVGYYVNSRLKTTYHLGVEIQSIAETLCGSIAGSRLGWTSPYSIERAVSLFDHRAKIEREQKKTRTRMCRMCRRIAEKRRDAVSRLSDIA